jgi:hypothetical protein
MKRVAMGYASRPQLTFPSISVLAAIRSVPIDLHFTNQILATT